ncbi:MAG TPA: copper chaperone PCu(A)C [Gammaproteobacteria bacterium]|nr:copper chaperone PCu(A)C [Gammaproteobacteria bacterium]
MTSMPTTRSLLTALALLLTAAFTAPGPSQANTERHEHAVGFSVNDARLRWLPGDLPLAGYFALTNTGQRTARLVGAASPAFARVMLHRSTHRGGVAHMEHVEGVDIAPGKTLHFAPGGYHLMLMKRRHRLNPGDSVPVTLRFADGRELSATFRVVGAGAQ